MQVIIRKTKCITKICPVVQEQRYQMANSLTLACDASFSTETMLGKTGNLGMSGSGGMHTLLLFLLNSISGTSAVVSG